MMPSFQHWVDLQSNSLYTALQLVTLFFWSHYSKTKVGFFYLCVVLWCRSQMTSAQDDHTNGLLRSKRGKQLFLTLNLLPAEDPNRGQGGVCTRNYRFRPRPNSAWTQMAKEKQSIGALMNAKQLQFKLSVTGQGSHSYWLTQWSL